MKFLLGFFSFNWLRVFDFLAPLAIRLFLAPILWVSGVKYLGLFSRADFVWYNPATWLNPEAFQASVDALGTANIFGLSPHTIVLVLGVIAVLGSILLILGFAVRWMVLALLFGLVILGALGLNNTDLSLIEVARQFVMQHGYATLLNNPVESYVVYFILLIALFFMGAGRWFSLDWYLYRSVARNLAASDPHYGNDPFEVDASDEPGLRKAV